MPKWEQGVNKNTLLLCFHLEKGLTRSSSGIRSSPIWTPNPIIGSYICNLPSRGNNFSKRIGYEWLTQYRLSSMSFLHSRVKAATSALLTWIFPASCISAPTARDHFSHRALHITDYGCQVTSHQHSKCGHMLQPRNREKYLRCSLVRDHSFDRKHIVMDRLGRGSEAELFAVTVYRSTPAGWLLQFGEYRQYHEGHWKVHCFKKETCAYVTTSN